MADLWLPNPRRGTTIAAGFDGSESDDWTAIKCETRAGLLFTPRYGPDRRPTIWRPEEWGGKIPRDQVRIAVDEVFARWTVARMYCDPPDWRSEIGEWAAEHGDKIVLEWPTYRQRPMFEAIKNFEVDLRTGRLRHDGCPLTTTAVGNARKVAQPAQRYGLAKADGEAHRKIDPAVASVITHEAATDAAATGWVPEGAKTPQISTAMYGFN